MAALYSHTTRSDGLVLTATVYNSDHQNHIDNGIPLQQDDYSVNVAQMKLATDPGEVSSESLATTQAGEFERLRFLIREITGKAQWYESPTRLMVGGNVITAHEALVIIDASVSTIDIDANAVLLRNSSNLQFTAESVNLTVDITASGANGLDTGAEAASTLYYLWVIYNGTTVAGLASVNKTIGTITLPSGYTFAGLVGTIYNNGSSNFNDLRQEGNYVTRKLATTSGTTIDWEGIPSGIKSVTTALVGVSTTGASNWLIQLGDAGGIEATGYLGTGSAIVNTSPSSTNYTAGLGIRVGGATDIIHGSIVFTLEDASDFTWTGVAILGNSNSNATFHSSTSKSLSAELDRVRLTTVGGSDTFDAGEASLSYRYEGVF